MVLQRYYTLLEFLDNVHVRRKFNDVIKQLSTVEEMKLSPALEVIKIIAKLYKHEARFKKEQFTPSRIKEERNSPYYLEIIDEPDAKVDSIDTSVSNLLRIAVNYYKNQRDFCSAKMPMMPKRPPEPMALR